MTVLRTLGLYNLIVLFLSSSFNISLQYDCVLLLVESAVSMATGDVLRCCDSGAVVLKLCESIDENAVKSAQSCEIIFYEINITCTFNSNRSK